MNNKHYIQHQFSCEFTDCHVLFTGSWDGKADKMQHTCEPLLMDMREIWFSFQGD